MAMNTPVIATRHGGALDIIQDGRNGFLFTPGDAIELSAVICKQKDISPTGLREYVLDHFTLKKMIDETIGVYERINHA
jgi:glycosyltransferase involved in cell wall biosynthesis